MTEGNEARGEVSVVVELDGSSGAGQAIATDIIEAAARAYVRALSVARARTLQPQDAVGLPKPGDARLWRASPFRPATAP